MMQPPNLGMDTGSSRSRRQLPTQRSATPFCQEPRKHRQLAVDARSAPGSILGNHAEDEFAQLTADAVPSYAI
jgi:hypothetical protein